MHQNIFKHLNYIDTKEHAIFLYQIHIKVNDNSELAIEKIYEMTEKNNM